MEYVMVPVPEEHVEAVQQYLRVKQSTWPEIFDPEKIAPLYHGGDDLSRRVLAIVASNARREEDLFVPQLAGLVEKSVREVVGVLIEINNRGLALALAPFGVVLINDTRETDPQTDGWDHRVVVMQLPVAREILAIADTEPDTDVDVIAEAASGEANPS